MPRNGRERLHQAISRVAFSQKPPSQCSHSLFGEFPRSLKKGGTLPIRLVVIRGFVCGVWAKIEFLSISRFLADHILLEFQIPTGQTDSRQVVKNSIQSRPLDAGCSKVTRFDCQAPAKQKNKTAPPDNSAPPERHRRCNPSFGPGIEIDFASSFFYAGVRKRNCCAADLIFSGPWNLPSINNREAEKRKKTLSLDCLGLEIWTKKQREKRDKVASNPAATFSPRQERSESRPIRDRKRQKGKKIQGQKCTATDWRPWGLTRQPRSMKEGRRSLTV
ncbi:hypothetical protein QBC38DRAFT_156418 [Podospora fimiseda]|uniref:Uncharacterized protein n=1 Tax=Podospora fimiseda TaxID=252190 RepID=A0AAN7H0B6_9PEZI|nr:hypothetical protein QBC38DRAFT_156418 [Podospora fimiseda]